MRKCEHAQRNGSLAASTICFAKAVPKGLNLQDPRHRNPKSKLGRPRYALVADIAGAANRAIG